MNCPDIETQLTSWLLGDLPADEAAVVEQHVNACDACRAAVREIEPTLDLLRAALAEPSAAPERLSVAHRRRIADYGFGAKEKRHRGRVIQWLFTSHRQYAAAAALVLVGFFALSALLMPSMSSSRARARAVKAARDVDICRSEQMDISGRGGRAGERDQLGDDFNAGHDSTVDLEEVPPRDSTVTRPKYGSTHRMTAEIRGNRVFDNGGSRQTPAGGGDKQHRPHGRRDAPVTDNRGTEDLGLVTRDQLGQGKVAEDPGSGSFAWHYNKPREGGDDARTPDPPDATPAPVELNSLSIVKSPAIAPAPKPSRRSAKPRRYAGEADESFAVGGSGSQELPDEAKKEMLRRVAAEAAEPLVASEVGREIDELKKDLDAKIVTETEGREGLWQKSAEEAEDEDLGGPRFKAYGANPFVASAKNAFSTFAIDVDTASYTLARNYMRRGSLPPAESVRTEEFVNFFDYQYKAPAAGAFTVYTDVAPTPFGRGLKLLKIGVKGRRLGREEQRPAVLTFLIDTSGSMNQADRLELVKTALNLLVANLAPRDRVAIVQYDSHARLLLEHRPASDVDAIKKAIDALQCGGSTNIEEGMRRAYELAAHAFVSGGENRVLLCSDGVANLGTVTAADILENVAAFRTQGITCSVFGFGMGSYDDTMLESLANKGDGTYAFIDSMDEARRVFVDDLSATLNTIASDVKIQVEFTPWQVTRYRQLGYENRQLRKQDFRNDAVDAGEVGSGQSVTALYELELADMTSATRRARECRADDRIAVVRVRYRRIDTGKVEEIEHVVRRRDVLGRFEDAGHRFRLAACAAEFSEILRGSPFALGSEYADVAEVLRPVSLELSLDHAVTDLLHQLQSAPGMSRGGL